jgi:hypothetical protein
MFYPSLKYLINEVNMVDKSESRIATMNVRAYDGSAIDFVKYPVIFDMNSSTQLVNERKSCDFCENIEELRLPIKKMVDELPQEIRFHDIEEKYPDRNDNDIDIIFNSAYPKAAFCSISSIAMAYGESNWAYFLVYHRDELITSMYLIIKNDCRINEDIPGLIKTASALCACYNKDFKICIRYNNNCRLIALNDNKQLKEMLEERKDKYV